MTQNVVKYGKREVTKEEFLAPGHRACIGCVEALAVRLAMKALGPNTIMVSATGCMEIISSQATTFIFASGLKAMAAKGIKPDAKINVVASAGDGGTSDIGLQALSGALERGHNMTYICWDNEAYMNTGIQRSSATPYGASTTTAPAGKKSIGQVTWKKNMPKIAVDHDIPYVATACPSYPFDLMDKVKKAAEIEGPTYVHILSVCPTGWRTSAVPEIGIEIGKLAVQTGVFPLYEVENGKYKLTTNIAHRKQVEEYLKPQGRFRHLLEEDIKLIQTRTDEEYDKLMELVEQSK